ncbi:MAG TPA: alpha/beta fold hydrolase [Nocardioidaceae bacterium]|nr:alpha/beta fold hydrolase [Nocardioidaceae bacterium]
MHISRYGDPSAPVMLLLHGGMLTGSMWEQQVDAFSSSHHVVVPDLPGHGRSTQDEVPTYAELAEMLAVELAGSRGLTAIGLGIGGQIALALIAAHPGLVRQAVVVSALTQEVSDPPWKRALNVAPLPIPLQRRSADAFREEKRAFRLPLGLETSGTRALVASGEREPREVIVSVAETAAAFVEGQALVVPGTGHDWIIHRPEEFNRVVSTWIQGQPVAV